MICERCGATVDDTLKKCDNCGFEFCVKPEIKEEPLEFSDQLPALIAQKKQKLKVKTKARKKLAIRIIACIAAVLIVSVFMFSAYMIDNAAGDLLRNAAFSLVFSMSSVSINIAYVFGAIALAVRATGICFAVMILLICFKN